MLCFEKCTMVLIGFSLQVICLFSLKTFSTLFLCWISLILIIICLGVDLLCLQIIRVLYASLICRSYLFPMLGKFSAITFANSLFILFVLSPDFSLTLINLILFCFTLFCSWRIAIAGFLVIFNQSSLSWLLAAILS